MKDKAFVRVFETPDEFIAWMDSQSAELKRTITLSLRVLLDLGFDTQVAAHLVYDLVQLSDEMRVMTPDNGQVH